MNGPVPLSPWTWQCLLISLYAVADLPACCDEFDHVGQCIIGWQIGSFVVQCFLIFMQNKSILRVEMYRKLEIRKNLFIPNNLQVNFDLH